MKEAAGSKYAVSQKLAYEKQARQYLEVNLEVDFNHCRMTK
jgi:hypothetical protein